MLVGNLVDWWKLARNPPLICGMQQTKSFKLYMFTCKRQAWDLSRQSTSISPIIYQHFQSRNLRDCSGSAGASVVAHSVALPLIEIAFSTLDCSIVPTCGAWGSATATKRGPLKQSWAGIQHSRDDEPLGVLIQMRNVRVNGFFFFDLRSAQVYCVASFLVSQ